MKLHEITVPKYQEWIFMVQMLRGFFEGPIWPEEWVNLVFRLMILLMAEILHHLRCMKPYK